MHIFWNRIISETPFKLILYFNYDPSINEYDSKRTLENGDYDKSLDIYNNKGENKVLLRRLSFFSKVKNFFKQNVETIVEKVIEKTVSFACVSFIKFMFKESYNGVVKGITEIACDELGEFAGEGITKLIFNSNSKPEENYKEIVYEESLENLIFWLIQGIYSVFLI